jgi:hypothetical protein
VLFLRLGACVQMHLHDALHLTPHTRQGSHEKQILVVRHRDPQGLSLTLVKGLTKHNCLLIIPNGLPSGLTSRVGDGCCHLRATLSHLRKVWYDLESLLDGMLTEEEFGTELGRLKEEVADAAAAAPTTIDSSD